MNSLVGLIGEFLASPVAFGESSLGIACRLGRSTGSISTHSDTIVEIGLRLGTTGSRSPSRR